jgi:hypothetical protein
LLGFRSGRSSSAACGGHGVLACAPLPAIVAGLKQIYGERSSWQIFVAILAETFATCFPPFGVIKLIFSNWK